MKIVFIIAAILVANVCAWPQKYYKDEEPYKNRIAAGVIVNIIDRISQRIKDRGLDPLYVEEFDSSYSSLIPNFFTASTIAQEVLIKGLSDIIVNDITVSLLRGVVSYDILLPKISSSIGYAATEVSNLGNTFSGATSGSLSVTNMRLFGRFSFRIGLISGFQVQELKIVLDVEDIQSNIYLNILGKDRSESVNSLLNNVPETLDFFNTRIAPILEFIIIRIINNLI